MLKKTLAALLALAMLFALAACSSESGSQEEKPSANVNEQIQEESKDDAFTAVETNYIADEVTIIGDSSTTLYPWGKAPTEDSLTEVYEYLFAAVDYCGEMKPVLADATRGEFGGYDHVAGTGDYTVYIYDYIHDQAGNHITASDVKWSFDTNHALEKLPGTAWANFESVEVIDETTVVFHFAKEIDGLGDLDDFWQTTFIISEKTYNDSPSNLTNEACGTGPYCMEEYVSGSHVTLVRNENYWQTNEDLMIQGQKANVKRINYIVNSEAAQQVIALQQGTVDVVANISSSNLQAFVGNGEYADQFSVFNYPQSGIVYVGCNNSEKSICHDVNMRLAIFYAIDVDGVVQAMGGETNCVKAYSLFSTGHSDYNPEWEKMENYQNITDYELSKQYREAAGYNGQTLKILCQSAESDVAQIVLNMLQNAGFKAELSALDGTTYNSVKDKEDGWDIVLAKYSAFCGAVSATRAFSADRSTGKTTDFIEDPEWNDMLVKMTTISGHTTENCNAWMEWAYENAYALGLYSKNNNIVYSNKIASLCRNSKNTFIPGGFTYVDPNA